MTLAPHSEWMASHDALDLDAAGSSLSSSRRAGQKLDLARACADGLRFYFNKLVYGAALPALRRAESGLGATLVKEARVVVREGMGQLPYA